jgi:hypothetical protein
MTRGAARTPARTSARANNTARQLHGIFVIGRNLPFIDWIAYQSFGSAADGGDCPGSRFWLRKRQDHGPAAASRVARDECSTPLAGS